MALIPVPVLVLAVLVGLSMFVSPVFTPIFSLMGVAGLLAGFFEEIGWTGFATPRLLSRSSPLTAGLVVGVLWGLWHGLADFSIRGGTLGAFWPVTFGLFVLSVTAWRVLIVWVYDKTQSGPLAQLMHFSYTSSLAFFGSTTLSRTDDALWNAVVAGALWVGVAVVYARYYLDARQNRTLAGLAEK